MRFYTKLGLCITLASILLTVSACVPRHLPSPPLPPHPGKVFKKLHRYHYFPGAQAYYYPDRRVYFYLSDSVWISAPILPPHIHIDIDHYVTIDIDGPKPYLHHREHLRRYPPGLRKEKHERQREKFDAKKERKRETVENKREQRRKKVERRREHKEERREDARDRKRDGRDDEDDDRSEKRRDRDDERGRSRKDRDRDDDYREKEWKNRDKDIWK